MFRIVSANKYWGNPSISSLWPPPPPAPHHPTKYQIILPALTSFPIQTAEKGSGAVFPRWFPCHGGQLAFGVQERMQTLAQTWKSLRYSRWCEMKANRRDPDPSLGLSEGLKEEKEWRPEQKVVGKPGKEAETQESAREAHTEFFMFEDGVSNLSAREGTAFAFCFFLPRNEDGYLPIHTHSLDPASHETQYEFVGAGSDRHRSATCPRGDRFHQAANSHVSHGTQPGVPSTSSGPSALVSTVPWEFLYQIHLKMFTKGAQGTENQPSFHPSSCTPSAGLSSTWRRNVF